jgi:hypothetical protein
MITRDDASKHKTWKSIKERFGRVILKFNSVVRAIRPGVDPDVAQRKVTRLKYLLNNVCAEEPDLYAITIQLWLLTLEVNWPKGVFQTDLQNTELWTHRSKLGSLALKHYRPGEFGWRKLVRRFRDQGNFVKDSDAFRRHLRRSAQQELQWLEDAYDLLALTAFFTSRAEDTRLTKVFDAIAIESSSATPLVLLRRAISLSRQARTTLPTHAEESFSHQFRSFARLPRPFVISHKK